MKLFIADDNIPFRNRLATILSDIEGIEIVGSAENVPNAIASIQKATPDAVILDIHMAGGSGFDVLAAIRSSHTASTVIMLTVGQRNEYQATSFAMGADYFFNKASDMKKMVRTIRNMARNSGAGRAKSK